MERGVREVKLPYEKPTEAVLTQSRLLLREQGWSPDEAKMISEACAKWPDQWDTYLKEHGWTLTSKEAFEIMEALRTAGWAGWEYVCHYPGPGAGISLRPEYMMPIEDLDLSTAAYNVLEKSGLITIGQVIEKSEDELLSLRDFGRKSYHELRDKLGELGILPDDTN